VLSSKRWTETASAWILDNCGVDIDGWLCDSDSMKSEFSVTTPIRATPARVFWFIADPSTAPVIDPAVISYEPIGGTMGLGVRNRIRMKMLGVSMTVTSETIEWKPGERMSFRSVEPGRPAVGIATHRFEVCPEGTLYTWSMEFVPTGVGGRITAGVSAAMFERNAVAQQDRVRRVLEAIEDAPPRDLGHPVD
jgi:hypothetical protein